MTIHRARALIVLVGSIALAWSLVFSMGLTAPTGTATSRGNLHASTGALIPAAQVSLQRPVAKAARQTLQPRQGLSSLPLAAQPAVSATLGENDGRYQVGAVGGALRAQNPAQALQADFTRQGMVVRSGQTHWRLALGGYGYGDRLEKAGEAVPHRRANRVEYIRGSLVEWYVNGPAGLEQGFTLSAPPASAASGTRDSSPLTIALRLGGDLRASADLPAKAQGNVVAQGLTLRDDNGQAVLRYTGLTAHDASGRELAAWLDLSKEELRLRVNDAGARYPVVVDPFVQQAILNSSDSAAGDELGFSASISLDGTTIVAGAPFNNPNQGAVYVFVMPPGGWATTSTFSAKLTASSAVSGDALLGWSVGVASNGGIVVAGGPNTNGSNAGKNFQGAVYVFVEPLTGWANETQTAMLTASDGGKDDYLGYSVGISTDGGTIVAGAAGASVGGNSEQGAAYVYVMPGSGWVNATETAKLTASDGERFDRFGYSVGVSNGGNTVVAGALNATVTGNIGQGAAYVYTLPGGGWVNSTETAKLTASEGAAGDSLGTSVSVSNDSSTIVAGAPGCNSNTGAGYVFVISGGVWGPNETAKLTNATGASGDQLGAAVGVSSNGSTIVAGAPGYNSNTGAAFIFSEPGTGWATTSTYTNELAALKVYTYNLFGNYLGISGNGTSIVAGVPGFNSSQGAVSVNLPTPTVTFTGAPATEPYLATFTVPDGTSTGATSPVYTSSGSCTNVGTTYTMTSGTGACFEIATWPADANYASVTAMQRTAASKIAPTVTFTGAPASAPYQGTFTVASTTNSSSLPIYTASGPCTNSGTATYTMTSGTGTCTSKVTFVSDANYLKASLTQTTSGGKIGQTVSFTTSAPATASYQSTFPVAASSTSGLTVALSVASGSVCSLGPRTTVGGVTSATVTMKGGTGTCYINANQAGNNNYTAAPQQQTWAAALQIGQTITITTPAPSSASIHSTFPVAADSSSGLTVALSVDAGSAGVCKLGPRTIVSGVTNATVTMLKSTGTCTIDANQAGNSNYTAAAQQQTSAAATP